MEKMSRPLPLNPTFIPPPYGVLRSLLENPLKLPLHPEDGERCPPARPALGMDGRSVGPPSPQGTPLASSLAGASISLSPQAPWPCFDEIEELTHHPTPPGKTGTPPSLSNV